MGVIFMLNFSHKIAQAAYKCRFSVRAMALILPLKSEPKREIVLAGIKERARWRIKRFKSP
jgi:hypothetical protein